MPKFTALAATATAADDKDCNEMFEHHCSATGGSCNNDNNTCVCKEAKTKSSSGSPAATIKKHPVGTKSASTRRIQSAVNKSSLT